MDAAAADAHAARQEQLAAAEAAKPRPRANLAASRAADVYAVDELVGGGRAALQALGVRDWLDAAAAGRPVTVRSRYVGRRLARLAQARDEAKLKLLRYVLLLLDVYAALKPAGTGGGGNKASKRLPEREQLRRATGVQDFLLEGVRKKFADGS